MEDGTVVKRKLTDTELALNKLQQKRRREQEALAMTSDGPAKKKRTDLSYPLLCTSGPTRDAFSHVLISKTYVVLIRSRFMTQSYYFRFICLQCTCLHAFTFFRGPANGDKEGTVLRKGTASKRRLPVQQSLTALASFVVRLTYLPENCCAAHFLLTRSSLCRNGRRWKPRSTSLTRSTRLASS